MSLVFTIGLTPVRKGCMPDDRRLDRRHVFTGSANIVGPPDMDGNLRSEIC